MWVATEAYAMPLRVYLRMVLQYVHGLLWLPIQQNELRPTTLHTHQWSTAGYLCSEQAVSRTKYSGSLLCIKVFIIEQISR